MGTLGTLCLALCLAVCISALPGEGAWERTTPGSGIEAPCAGDGCPRHKKSATLVPSFTKTTTTTTHRTTPPTTTHPANHTTTHPANHTTTHHTTPPTTTHPANHSTTHPANHTTTHRTSPPTTTHPANHSTTHPANHTTTHRTTPPTTTHPANHTTTHHTMPPTTTHPANHTTTHPANHTTAHRTTPPTTTHPANHTTPHPTTPAPPRPPDAAVGNYSVRNGSDVCLRVQSALQIRVQYENPSKAQLWGAFAIQPNHTHVSGNCSDHSATLELNFTEGSLHFTFLKNKTSDTVYLHEVQANLSLHFPGATRKRFEAHNASLREFEARLGHSYRCQNRSLALTPDVHLDALHEQIQAFALPGGRFGEAELCPEERRSALVPIIVGVVLLILILIIVIAYLVGRRRARGGYQTI